MDFSRFRDPAYVDLATGKSLGRRPRPRRRRICAPCRGEGCDLCGGEARFRVAAAGEGVCKTLRLCWPCATLIHRATAGAAGDGVVVKLDDDDTAA